jgi:hypothetical protein
MWAELLELRIQFTFEKKHFALSRDVKILENPETAPFVASSVKTNGGHLSYSLPLLFNLYELLVCHSVPSFRLHFLIPHTTFVLCVRMRRLRAVESRSGVTVRRPDVRMFRGGAAQGFLVGPTSASSPHHQRAVDRLQAETRLR